MREVQELMSIYHEFMRDACLLCDSSELEIKSGCLIMNGADVLSKGWNTSTCHAEVAALYAVKSIDLELLPSAQVYCTRFPCPECCVVLVNAGVTSLYYMSDHFSSNNSGLEFMRMHGVCVTQLPEEEVWAKNI